jgi:nucleolar protein 53
MFVLIVFRQIIDWVDSLPEPPLELVLPDELQDSLRLLKPEGNLLKDRFRNILMRGKMETRKPIQQPKKKRRTYTEKWTYKDFVAPS